LGLPAPPPPAPLTAVLAIACICLCVFVSSQRDALDERGIKEKALKERLIEVWNRLAPTLLKRRHAAADQQPNGASGAEAEGGVGGGRKRAASEAAQFEEPRRSSRVKDVADTREAIEAAKAVAEAAAAAAAAGAAAGARGSADHGVGYAGAPAGPAAYEPLVEPWRHASWERLLPESLDALGALKAELLALGSRTVRLCGAELLGSEASTWRRDVKLAATIGDLVRQVLLCCMLLHCVTVCVQDDTRVCAGSLRAMRACFRLIVALDSHALV